MANVVTLRFDINGSSYLVDTYTGESIQISKKVQDVNYVESAQGVITKQTFRISLTGQARVALGNLEELQFDLDYDIRKSIQGSILVNNFPRFVGSFTILNIYNDVEKSTTEVELVFKGSETNLKAVLSEITVASLLEGETLPYTALEISEYFADPLGKYANEYAWPLIDLGQNLNSGSSFMMSQQDFKPAVSIYKLLSLLNEKEGYSVAMDSEYSDLENQYIPLHNSTSKIANLNTNPKSGSGRIYISSPAVQNMTVNENVDYFPTINMDSVAIYDDNYFDLTADSYTAQLTGSYTIKPSVSGSIANANSSSRFRIRVGIKINGVSQSFTSFSRSSNGAFGLSKSANIDLVAGDVITFFYSIRQTYSFVASDNIDLTTSTAQLEVIATPLIAATSVVELSKNVPGDLTAWDIVRTLITQSNGILVPTEAGFDIVPWVKWVDTTEIFELDKVELKQQIQIIPTSVEAPKRIVFTYEEDKDTLNELYTEITGKIYGSLVIEDTGTDFGTETKEIKIPFAATPLSYIDGTNLVIPKFINKEGKLIETKPRLLHWDSNSDTMGVAITLTDAVTGVDYEVTSVPFFGHWQTINGGYSENDYNFGTNPNFWAAEGYPNNTLYNRFWRQYILETYSVGARKVKMKAKLYQHEVDSIEMNEIVMWRNNKMRFTAINNFDMVNDSMSDVELVYRATIENIDIAPYYPYDVVSGVVQFKDSSDNSVVASPTASDLQESCEAYGYYYDAINNLCIQRSELLTE